MMLRPAALVVVVLTMSSAFAMHAPDIVADRFQEKRLAVLAPLEGVWFAKGEGFSSRLTYEWALPDVLFRARNEVRNTAGAVVAEYEGHYLWDPASSRIVFWTVSRSGEVHRGVVTVRDERIWHDATVSGGTITAYRSVIAPAARQLRYHAKYETSPTDDAVLSSPPLIYERVATKRPGPPSAH